MKILHTADWHIGQLFHEYDRNWEHEQFLDWLVGMIRSESIDVLLVSGDVFDNSNPSAAALKLFYTFLNRATQANPSLQIIITAGNHDSAARLESPKPLLESSNIHIVGVIEKDVGGNIDFGKLTIPLKAGDGSVAGWCLAIPFLRMGDYPAIEGSEQPYSAGVARVYAEAYAYVSQRKEPGQWMIALGHLHTQDAAVGDMDRQERLIMGGIELVPASAFHDDLSYVALGHIHRAQRIGAREHVRYSGSPLPMSFSERAYRHQVLVFELNGEGMEHLQQLEVPVAVPLMRIPAVHSHAAEVIGSLAQLPAIVDGSEVCPYLEVVVLADGPDPGLRHRIMEALVGKAVRLARIDVRYEGMVAERNGVEPGSSNEREELRPVDVFSRTYQSKYGSPVPEGLMQLFLAVAAGVTETE
ncbi:MAG: exonuclease SbcCD subunit D C-terminal domain-containing protein [Puia sp.]|nr:exonuclease SbcCD subunit D C-terminal domain-containing protein [Puia sp.]